MRQATGHESEPRPRCSRSTAARSRSRTPRSRTSPSAGSRSSTSSGTSSRSPRPRCTAAGTGRSSCTATPTGSRATSSTRSASRRAHPSGSQTALITFPSGRTATMPVMADAAHLAWHATLGCLDINPWPVRSERRRSSRRAPCRSRPGAGSVVRRRARGRARHARRPAGPRPPRIPQDERQARDPRQRADRAEVDVHGGPPRGARARARGRAPDPGQGDDRVVERGAPGRVRRLQPERPGPHRRERVLDPSGARRPRVDADRVG